MTILRTVLRRARTLLWTALSILIILAAVAVGVGKLLMPYSTLYQPELEAWLSREFGRPVELESFTGEWNAFGPRLRLRGMRLASPSDETGADGLAIAEAALDVKPLNALLPGRAWYNFLVIGADLSLVEVEGGGFELSGLGVPDASKRQGSAGFRNLIGIGELILEDSKLEYVNAERGIRLQLTGIEARVQFGDESGALTLSADLADEEAGRVYGEVEATAVLAISGEGRISEASWYLGLQDVMLDALRPRLPDNRFLPQQGLVNGAFWGDWSAGRPMAMRGVADLRNARLDHETHVMRVEHANARLGWTYGSRGHWRLDLHELRIDDGVSPWVAPDIALERNLDRDLGLWISADSLPVEVSLRLARDILAVYGTPWPEFLPDAAEGDVSGLELVLDADWRLRLLRGQAHNAGVRDWHRWPSLAGVDAIVDLSAGAGAIELHARALEVDWPGMFAETLRFSMPSCQAELDLNSGWQLALRQCSLINEDLALTGDLQMAGNSGRPAVDAHFLVSRGAIGRVSPYWPERILKPRVLDWLRGGLRDGEIEEARFQIFGDMDDWPFRNHRGRFEASARVRGARLEYAPGWPGIRDLDADLHFVGPAMSIVADAGRVGSVGVQRATAKIADFKRPVLEVRYEARSQLPDFIDFLRRSPILARADYALDRFEFSGPAATTGEIRVPLGRATGELTVNGDVTVRDGKFSDPASDVALGDIVGALQYDRGGMRGQGLKARYQDRPAVLDVFASQTTADRFRATMTGRFDIREVLPEFLRDAEPFDRLEGESEWRASVVVPGAAGASVPGPWLSVESLLDGIAIDLPAPLRKAPTEAAALRLRYPLSGETRMLEAEIAGRASLRLELRPGTEGLPGATALRVAAGLGGRAPELPAVGFVRLDGHPEHFDLDGWIDLVTDLAKSRQRLGDLEVEQFELAIGQLLFLDRRFDEVVLRVASRADEVRAEFAGEGIEGRVLFTPGPRGGSLSAEFERLALDKPVASGIPMRSNPAELPELHLYAQSFRYAGIEMGETRIEAYPTPGGFHFEKVEAESDSLTLRATGDWLMQEGGPRSDFRILVTTESLGEFLESVDISSSLTGGQTVLRFNAWWPGPPGAFALSRLNGEVEFSITRGQITNASAGSGRLLGLLSIQALPRRLSLDFRDVFDAGFDFEEARGTFRMENGTASTDDVELSSSAASISLKGSTDLVGQHYDHVMTVRPGVGNTLPVIGAIAGGPGGAAAGLALQGLLHDELGQATQVRYTIKGSWDEPTIEPVLEEPAESEPVADGP